MRCERAHSLVDRAHIEGISRQDAAWLAGHTAACGECARYAEATARVVRGLSGFAFDSVSAAAGSPRPAQARRSAPLVWVWAAAALLVAAAGPVYQGVRKARQDRADTRLLEEVELRVGRRVPAALEPLLESPPGDSR